MEENLRGGPKKRMKVIREDVKACGVSEDMIRDKEG